MNLLTVDLIKRHPVSLLSQCLHPHLSVVNFLPTSGYRTIAKFKRRTVRQRTDEIQN